MTYRYLGCVETAKLVRKALKGAFPGTKFYVRSKNSINISWMDGPTQKEVDAVVGVFAGSDFDGMIDLKCYYRHWLMPDGTVQVANGSGTEGSMGTIPSVDNPKPHPDAELVSLGSDFVFTDRGYSRELVERVGRTFSEKMGWDVPPIQECGWWAGGKQRGNTYSFERGYGSHNDPYTLDEYEWFNRELWATSEVENGDMS